MQQVSDSLGRQQSAWQLQPWRCQLGLPACSKMHAPKVLLSIHAACCLGNSLTAFVLGVAYDLVDVACLTFAAPMKMDAT